MKFGDNLRNLRKLNKISQEQLAEKIGVSRQSVSKWECSEAYPEMDNILELCKIFNCKINDIVHADLSDINSLDEEIIMNVVKFNEKKQNQVKSLSNIISLIGQIGGIVLKVCVPFVILVMMIIPYVINNVYVSDSVISFKTEDIELIDDELEIHDMIILKLDEDVSNEEIIYILNNNSKFEIICYLEGGLLFLIIDLLIMIFILSYVEKLFKNIKEDSTPFTLENVNYIKRISYLMIALIMISPLSSMIFSLLIDVSSSDVNIELMSILEILIIFSMSYVFEYGYEIQKDSKGKMYGNESKSK